MIFKPKALGTGFITTALRARRCPDVAAQAAVASMIRLNDVASAAAVRHQANAATDITGFGLAGHAIEMARASEVTLQLSLAALPRLPYADSLCREGFFTRANWSNRQYTAPFLRYAFIGTPPDDEILFDPQTSGGLLVSIPSDRAQSFCGACAADGKFAAPSIIGEVQPRGDHALVVRD